MNATHAPLRALLLLACTLGASSALAQGDPMAPPAPVFAPTEPAPEATPQQPVDAQSADGQPVAQPYATSVPMLREDGPRFRFGVGFGGGGEFVDEFSAWLVGFDFRFGVQVNDMIGVYVQPHLSFGQGTSGTVSGGTGTFAIAAMVDLTFAERFFAGAGFGYGVVNNPNGLLLAARGGVYPALSSAPDRARRKGLSLSFDLRTYFTGVGPVLQVMGMIGYESF